MYIGSSPTVPTPSFSASSGLTGAAVALTAVFLVSNGSYYWVQSSDATQLLHYQNVGGVATADNNTGPMPTSAALTSLLYVPNALSGYLPTVTTFGTTPTAGTGNDLGVGFMQCAQNWSFTQDGFLDSITIWVKVVGDGTMRFEVMFPYTTDGATFFYARIQQVNISGIASTGLTTFRAGTHFPAGLAVFNGARLFYGTHTGGAQCSSTTYGSSTVLSYAQGSGLGYNTSLGTSNILAGFQATLSDKNYIGGISQGAIKAREMAKRISIDGSVIEYSARDNAVGTTATVSSTVYPIGGYPVTCDGILKGVEYTCKSGDEGDVYFVVFHNNVYQAHFRATITSGSKLWLDAPSGENAIYVQQGDLVITMPITGSVAAQGYTAQPSIFFQTTNSLLFSGLTTTDNATGSYYAFIPSYRVAVERPKSRREFAQAGSRGNRRRLRETFPGTSLPAKWSQYGGSTFTCNSGLVSPSSPTAQWTNICWHSDYSNAHRHTATAIIEMGNASNIGGLIWVSQNAATLPYGTVAVIDGPANALKVYRGGNPGPTDGGLSTALPWTVNATDIIQLFCRIDRGKLSVTARNQNTGQSVTINSTMSKYSTWGGLMRGRIGAVFYSGPGSMKWRRIDDVVPWSSEVGAKLIFQDSTADFDDGDFVRPWWILVEDQWGRGNVLNCAKGALDTGHGLDASAMDFIALLPQAATITGSIAVGSAVLTVTSYSGAKPLAAGQVISARPVGTPGITVGTTILAQLTGTTGGVGTYSISNTHSSGLPSSQIAVVDNNAANGVEVFWGLGVNPRHGGAETDAQWYANYKTDTQQFAAMVTGTGGKFTLVTPNPGNFISTYVHLLVSNILAGDVGDFDVVDINRNLATSNANRGTWASTTYCADGDGLHPDPIFRTPLIMADFLDQRPDMAGF